MKKMFLVMALLMLAVPAMAAVTVTATDAGDGSGLVTVSYTGSGVRAFALDITVDGGAIISDVNDLSADYRVNPGSVNIDGAGNISGSVVCDAGQYAGTLDGEGTSGITTEQGSLYVGAVNAPAASGDLFSFVVDKDCCVSIAVNAIRAGVVMEDPEEDPGLTIVDTCVDVDEGCVGDFTGTSDGMEFSLVTYQLEFTGNFDAPNGQVDTTDLAAIINLMVNMGDASYTVPAAGYEAFDITGSSDGMEFSLVTYQLEYTGNFDAPNGQVDTTDLAAIINMMVNTGDASYTVICP